MFFLSAMIRTPCIPKLRPAPFLDAGLFCFVKSTHGNLLVASRILSALFKTSRLKKGANQIMKKGKVAR